jgi:predicted Zn-dependent protease
MLEQKVKAVVIALTVCLVVAGAASPQRALAQAMPRNLAPGLYYYFKSGEDRPSVFFVPNPADRSDPFSKPVRPLPVPGLENFPILGFDSLRNYSFNDLKAMADQSQDLRAQPVTQSAATGSAGSLPAPQNVQAASAGYYQGDGQAPELNRSDLAPSRGSPPPPFSRYDPSQAQPPPAGYYTGNSQTTASYPAQGYPAAGGAQGQWQQAGYPPAYAQAFGWGGQQQGQSGGTAAPQLPSYPVTPGYGRPPGGYRQGGPAIAMGAPPSPFRAMAPGTVDVLPRGRINGVSLEQMEQASQWARQAVKYIHQNKYAEASYLLEQASQFDPNPNSAAIHGNLAIACSHLGNLDQALNEYGKALQYDPKDRLALLGIASTYQSKGDIPQAQAWTHKFLELYPTAPEVPEAKKMLASLDKASQSLPTDNPNGPDYYESVTRLGPVRWAPERFPLKVYIEQSSVRGYKRAFKKYLTDAFDEWAQATGNRTAWQQVNDRDQADIVCSWTGSAEKLPESTGAEGGQTGTAIRHASDGWEIGKATITLVTFDMQGKQATDDAMQTCCLHEVGHALGLKGHSSNNRDIMFFSESPTNSHTLTNRDIATIRRLYATYQPASPGTAGSQPALTR